MTCHELPRRLLARLLLVALAPFALDGCVSVGLARSVREGAGAGSAEFAVAISQTTSDRDSGSPVPYPVLTELARVEGAARTVVARSMAATWTLGDVAPGRYLLRTAKKIDEHGDVVPLKGPVEKELELKAGEKVEAKVVLEKVPVFWIVLAALTVILLVVLAIDAGSHLDLPPPPPLPPVFVQVALEIPLGHASGPAAVEPGVADVYPAPGSVVAARKVAVSFFVTVPIDETSIEKDAVLAVGSRSGEIQGTVEWRADERFLSFVPSQDFTGGETVTVTLDLEKVQSAGGRSGRGRVSTSFQVP